MLGSYRKRFVLSNMALVGVVLLAVYTTLLVTNVRGAYNNLRSTMQQLVEPMDEPNAKFQKLEKPERSGSQPEAAASENTDTQSASADEERPEKPTGPKADNADGTPPEPPQGGKWPKRENVSAGKSGILKEEIGFDRAKIITVFYNDETKEISTPKKLTEIDNGLITRAVESLLTREDGFGRLKDCGLFYYMEQEDGQHKIALVSDSYLTANAIKMAVLFTLTFWIALGLFFLISLWLSKLAAKPMENAMQMQRQFVDDVSHDLKTPITVILANNSIIKSNPEETVASQKQWLDATDEAAKNMMHMINEMLSLSSLEALQSRVAVVSVDLTSAAEKAVLQMESVAFDRGITVEDEIAEHVTALAAQEYAERICNSLLENALKYEPDGGRVRVTLQAVKKHAIFTVQNFGAVISEEDLPHVFERFYRSDKARASAGGHGLGLPIVKQICSLIGAEISAESGEDKGTIFRVSFVLGSSAAKNAGE